MARRVAELDYRVVGAEGAASKVRTVSDAMAAQARNARAAVPALAAAQRGTGFLGTVSQSAMARVQGLSGALGPLGSGLGAIALRAPMAANGILGMVAAQERMGLLSRVSNAALLGGAGVMAAGSVAAMAYAGNVIRGADAYTALSSRIRIFSADAASAAANEADLYARAKDARASVEGLSTLFVRITPAIQDMGRAQSDALEITELSSKALAIQGATAAEAMASTIQLSQAIASGVLRGDELKSMLESSPLLLRYISENIEIGGKIGVAFGQMRSLGEEGALTAERLISALLRAGPQIEKDFANAPKTAAQGWVMLKDELTRTVGQMSQTTGLQNGVFEFLADLTTKLDSFRQRVLLDPSMLDPIIEAGHLFGETLEIAGRLAQGVAANFDLIVGAAQGLIALKLGDVFAGMFAAGAQKVQGAIGGWNAAKMMAGDEFALTAAIQARTTATQMQTRATDLNAKADIAARTAASARAAAEIAVAEATALKAAAGTDAVIVSQAESRASAQVALANSRESAAKGLLSKATTAQSAASAQLTLAQQLEGLATNRASAGLAAKAMVMKGLSGAYALIGGPIGALTIALGLLAFATFKVIEANQAQERKFKETAAAVRAQTEEYLLLDQAQQAIGDETGRVVTAQDAALVATAALTGEVAKLGDEYFRLAVQAKTARLEILETKALEAAQQTRAAIENYQVREQRFAREARGPLGDPGAGAALAGTAFSGFSASDTARRRARQTEEHTIMMEAAANATRATRELRDARRDDPTTLVDRPTPSTSTGGGESGGRGRSRTDPNASIIQTIADAARLAEMMDRVAASTSAFAVVNGQLLKDGSPFVARSEDEGRAALAYVEQLEAARTASASLIDESGFTREALADQAAQTLANALATSSATQAEQRWQERMAEARGESTAVAQAEREVADARRAGVTVTEQMEQAYVDLVRAQEASRRSDAALQTARPIVDAVVRETLEDMGRMPEVWNASTGEMGLDFEAAMRQWAAAKVRILAEAETRIREHADKLVADGKMTAIEAAEAVAAARVAVEVASAEQTREVWNRLREEDERAWQQRFDERLQQEQELADGITGSLEDLFMGGDPSDLGRRFGEDLLRGVYEELIGNPLNLAIRTFLRSLVSGDGTQGLWSQVLGAVGIRAGTAAVTGGIGGGGGTTLPIGGAGGVGAPVANPFGKSSLGAALSAPPQAAYGEYGAIVGDLARAVESGDLGYAYRPTAMDFDRDRSAAESRGLAASTGNIEVNIINETSEPVEATSRRNPLGGVDVILRPMIRSEIQQSGADGTLNKALGKTPRPIRR